MPELSDDILLDKLRQEENDSYSLLYKKYFPSIANYIEQNSGNDQDAEDIFQESIIILLGKVRQSDFNLTSSLKTYLFSIAKNLWLKKIKSDKNSLIQNALVDIVTINLDDEAKQNDKESKLATWLGNTGLSILWSSDKQYSIDCN